MITISTASITIDGIMAEADQIIRGRLGRFATA